MMNDNEGSEDAELQVEEEKLDVDPKELKKNFAIPKTLL
jgi:hypothetical protein